MTDISRWDLFCWLTSDRSPTLNQVNFNNPHKNEVNLGAHTKTKRFATQIQKRNQFRPPIQTLRQSITALKQVNLGPHTVNFDPPHKHQVSFDHNTKTKSNSIPQTKINIVSTHPLKSSQIDPHYKTKSISMPRHKKQVNFDADTKIKYSLPPRQKPSEFRPRH